MIGKIILICSIISLQRFQSSHSEAPHDINLSSNVKLNAPSVDTNVTLTCSNRGGPTNVYEWRKDEIILISETNNTLKLNNIEVTSGGDYTCTVHNAAGVDSTTTTLYIAPYITPLDEELSAFNGSTINVTCEADGFPPPTVNWVNMTNMVVSNTTLLDFSPVLVGDEGIYRCVATLKVNGSSIDATDETNLIGMFQFLIFLQSLLFATHYILFPYQCPVLPADQNKYQQTAPLSNGRKLTVVPLLFLHALTT